MRNGRLLNLVNNSKSLRKMPGLFQHGVDVDDELFEKRNRFYTNSENSSYLIGSHPAIF